MKKTKKVAKEVASIRAVNPLNLAQQFKVLIIFHRSRSPYFSTHLEVAKTAPFFLEQKVQGKSLFFVGFNADAENYPKLLYLTYSLGYFKGTTIFIDGIQGESNHLVNDVVSCYMELVRNGVESKNWCTTSLEKVSEANVLQVPCQLCLKRGVYDDIIVAIANNGVLNLCPAFDLRNLKYKKLQVESK